MNTARFYSKGFSLIEMMVAIVIVALGLALAAPNYRVWMVNTRIRTVAESLSEGLQRARAEAVARNTTVTFSMGSGFFWSITDAGGTTIESRPSGELPSTVLLTPNPTSSSAITYGPLGTMLPNPDGTAPLTQVSIDIDPATLSPEESRYLRIEIGAGGGARLCDPAVSASNDIRKCAS